MGGRVSELLTVADLYVTSGFGGHLADPVCSQGHTLQPSAYARYAEWLREQMRGVNEAVLFDTGGLLAPHGVSRFAAQQRPKALARLVRDVGYRALAFGEAELGAPRDGTIDVIGALREHGIPTLANNLFCRPAAQALCDVLVDGSDGVSFHRIGEWKVALISVLTPEALERVVPERAKGIRLIDPAEAVAASVRRARERGAALVVASVNDGRGAAAAARALDLARQLPESAKPDLLISAGAGEQFVFSRPVGYRPAIVAAPPGGAARVDVRRNLLADTYDALARPVPPADVPHPAAMRFIHEIGEGYCARWGGKLAGGKLDRPLVGSTMLELAAGSMRDVANAEIAMLDRSVLDPAWSPSQPDSLSASDVYVALRYDEPLVVANVKGEWLQQVANGDYGHLVVSGLGKEDGSVEVNGRSVEPRGSYRVVTLRLLTLNDKVLPGGPEWKALPNATLRSVVLAHLEHPREVDPRDALPDPTHQPEWTVRSDLDGSFTGTTVNSPPAEGSDEPIYEETQLRRAETNTFSLRARIRADMVTPQWGWDNLFESRYSITRTARGDSNEGDDQTSLRSTARWRGLRARVPYFFTPEPFVETYFETELTKSQSGQYHHMLLRPTTGLQFTFTDHLSVKVTAGFETQLLSSGYGLRPGGGGQIVLKRWPFLQAGARSVALEGSVDYFVSDVVGEKRQTLRGDLKTSFDLVGPLALGINLDLFLVREQGNPAGVVTTGTVFLRVSWVGRAVGP